MKVKITPRKPEGVLVDLEGSEVKSGGKVILSLSNEQCAALAGLLVSHLSGMNHAAATEPKVIRKGRHS